MAKAAIKFEARDMTIADAISDAYGELSGLGEEMRDAFDNTPESLQQSGVGEARGEAADTLENLSEPEVPEALGATKVEWSVRVLSPSAARRQTRADRRDLALETLSAVIDKLEEIKDGDGAQELKDEAEALADEVEQLKSEAEDVSFPGMYG